MEFEGILHFVGVVGMEFEVVESKFRSFAGMHRVSRSDRPTDKNDSDFRLKDQNVIDS